METLIHAVSEQVIIFYGKDNQIYAHLKDSLFFCFLGFQGSCTRVSTQEKGVRSMPRTPGFNSAEPEPTAH